MKNFPTVRLALIQSLLAMRQEYGADPALLNAETCPYDAETVAALKELLVVPAAYVPVEMEVKPAGKVGRPRGEDALAKMRSETRMAASEELETVRSELNKLREDGKILTDVGDRISVIKTAVALTEKIVVLEERVYNVKRTARFQQMVIADLDDLMPVDNRSEFLSRLATYAESE